MAYQGHTVQIPIGQLGFSNQKNHSRLTPAHLVLAQNASLDGNLLQKVGGASALFNSEAGDVEQFILAGINWKPTPSIGEVDVIFTGNTGSGDGKIIRDSGPADFNFNQVLASGQNWFFWNIPVFVTAGHEDLGEPSKLFCFNRGEQVQVVSGSSTSTSDISTPPADWSTSFPLFGLTHAGRMWAGGNDSDQHRIYYSLTADHEDFTTSSAGSLSIFPGEGDRLVGGVSFRGLLILFKHPIGVYVVDTRDPSPSNWQISKISEAVGAINHQCIVPIENDVLFMDVTGTIHALSATQRHGDVNTSAIGITQDIQKFIRDNSTIKFLSRSSGLWYPDKRQAWFSVPIASPPIHLVIDFNDPEMGPRFLLNRRDTIRSMWLSFDPDEEGNVLRPMIGGADHDMYLLDRDARNKNGSAYEMIAATPDMDLSFADPQLAAVRKNGQFLELVGYRGDATAVDVEVYWDGVLSQTITFNTLNGSGGLFSVRRRLVGSGRRIKLIVKHDALDENVQIAEFLLSFTVSDERTTE